MIKMAEFSVSKVGTVAKVIAFDDEVTKDPEFTHSTFTNNERISVNQNGTYLVTATLTVDQTGANRVTPYIELRTDGVADTTTRAQCYSRGSAYGDYCSMTLSAVVDLEKDQYLDLWGYKRHSETTYVVNTLVAHSRFSVVKLDGLVEEMVKQHNMFTFGKI